MHKRYCQHKVFEDSLLCFRMFWSIRFLSQRKMRQICWFKTVPFANMMLWRNLVQSWRTNVVCQTIIHDTVQNSDSQTVRQSDEGQRWKYKNLSTSPPTTLPSSSGVAPASRFGGGAGSNPGIFISNWETSCSWEEIGYKFQHRFENYPHQGTSGWAVGQCIPKRRDQPYLRVPEMWLH